MLCKCCVLHSRASFSRARMLWRFRRRARACASLCCCALADVHVADMPNGRTDLQHTFFANL